MSGSWSIRVRIPGWTQSPTISVNGTVQNVTATPGSYATINRTWQAGDVLTVRLPMRVIMVAANDNPNVQAVTYGPTVLCGNYGSSTLSALPTLAVNSISRTSSSSLAFTATANASPITLHPFQDAQSFNYTVYWHTGGASTPAPGRYTLANAGTGLIVGITDMSSADNALAMA